MIIQHHYPFTNVVKVDSSIKNIKRQNMRSYSYFMQSSTVSSTINDSITSTNKLISSTKDPFIAVSSHQLNITSTNDAALVKSAMINKINNHVSLNHFDFTNNIKVLRKSAVALCIALVTSYATSSNEVVLAATVEPTHQTSLEMNILPVGLEPDIIDLETLKVFRVSIGWLVGWLVGWLSYDT
jgi:hypothetical protein